VGACPHFYKGECVLTKMDFDIDVSGEEILSKDYTICVANNNGIIKGFKFDESLIRILCSRFGQGMYRYKNSGKQKATFKLRLYCIVIHYLFKSIKKLPPISLKICKDFDGKVNDINSNLRYLIETELGIKIENTSHEKLSNDSSAHEYAYLMRRDRKNKMETYVKISLEDFERFLKK